ncbi:hypothetical protein AMECASPLE_034951, partial [Ameca splendens]
MRLLFNNRVSSVRGFFRSAVEFHIGRLSSRRFAQQYNRPSDLHLREVFILIIMAIIIIILNQTGKYYPSDFQTKLCDCCEDFGTSCLDFSASRVLVAPSPATWMSAACAVPACPSEPSTEPDTTS